MSSIQEPEVQFAQRLASNEKPIRTKAIKKLRKYINVRSQKATGGFSGDELLKLWKGLFYCLWMQDKPLLQEELSNQISTLIHSFHDIDGQFLYLENFLQTFKREWTGIDRLRMDKFFQLVRFMFRQTFELLKRKNWEHSVVFRFLDLLKSQVLQSDSGTPIGLQFHILDLYMTELAAVGSAELTADQNLIFIKPFCKTAARTKDQSLFRAICSSIFSTIIDQAPFAIDDLMKEVKAAEASESDSGQVSEVDDEEDQLKEKTTSKPISKKRTSKQINGNNSNEEEDDSDEDDEDDDEENEDDEEDLFHLENSDTEMPCDDVGPVLQFDYAALADELFQLASRSSTPSKNRQRLYKIIKVLRDLSEGNFPQDDYPEEVSTDEDDDMFGSRKRMKRRGGHMAEDEEWAPATKKSMKKEASTLNKQNKDLGKDEHELADQTANNENKKKKRKRKKPGHGGSAGTEENTERSEQEQGVAQSQSLIEETEGGAEDSQVEDLENKSQAQCSVSSVKVTEAATPQGQSETLVLSEVTKQPSVTLTEETSQPTPCTTANKEPSEKISKMNKKNETSELIPEVTDAAKEQQSPVRTEPEMSSEANAPASGKKKRKKKKKKAKLHTEGQTCMAESQLSAEAEITAVNSEESAEKNTTTPETDATYPGKKKKGLRAKNPPMEANGESQVNSASTEADGPTTGLDRTDSKTPVKKKNKKKNLKADEAQIDVVDEQLELEGKQTDAEIASTCEEASQDITAVPLKKKTKQTGKREDAALEVSHPADESTITPLKKKRKMNQEESKTTVEEERAAVEPFQVADAEKLLCEITMTTPAKKKKKKLAAAKVDEIPDQTQEHVVGSVDEELPMDETKVKPAKKKRRKIPVVFEFEADELEAAAQGAASVNGHAEEETVAKVTKLCSDVGEQSTPVSTKKSQKKAKSSSGLASNFITFQSNAAVPTPLFCKTKGSPSTPLSSKKKSRAPKSDFKKVTFGLKNNKTAEFRKTDRSLLVSPDGSSRVPFDPQQKPKFGVLKSPPTPFPVNVQKTPKGNRKATLNASQSTPRRRAMASDFF